MGRTTKTTGANLHTRVPRTTADRLNRLARRNGRSVAEELRRAVDRHLETHDAPERG